MSFFKRLALESVARLNYKGWLLTEVRLGGRGEGRPSLVFSKQRFQGSFVIAAMSVLRLHLAMGIAMGTSGASVVFLSGDEGGGKGTKTASLDP